MHCPDCEHENPGDARFCNRCGAVLAMVCLGCERRNPPEASFCNGCGQSLEGATGVGAAREADAARDPREYTPRHLAERILKHKSALEGERKHVTVLFADLADSTALAERIDPEEMHSLLDRAFQHILAQVHHYEGTVNQFKGDGVMALFGAPIALEDAPRRAVLSALAIHRELADLDREVNERFGRGFQMRIGINTGPVVVGKIGDDLRMDYTAVGDTTNLASRLEQMAEPGQVLVSATTGRVVEGFFDLRALEPVQVKGKSDPVQAFEVMAQRSASGRIDALAESGLTEFIGRNVELDSLLTAMASAREGRGQVAFIVGEAGIGKSRLLHEFRNALEGTPHQWWEGRCASYGRATPFHAIVDGVRRNLGVEDRDDESAIAARLEAAESEAGGELEWTLPFIRKLLSLPSGDDEVDAMDAMFRRSETCRALHARMLRASRVQPQVIVIEDLHWIDAASEEFLGFLAESTPAAPVLLVMTHRPGYQHPFGDRSYHVRIPVQALPSSAISRMVSDVLDAEVLPDGLERLIATKADGNPLFVEELTRSLVEEGVVRTEGGQLSLADDIADIRVPDRIQDVLMARLDRLPDAPKQAIQMASVIGREFAMRLLERITEVGERIGGIVDELRALELIHEKAAYPELAYMFKHALTHDVAYESILIQRRKTLHGIVGAAIEELYRDRLPEHFEALAYHFEEAADWPQALRYHELAANKSAAAFANHAAVEHCEAGLEISARLDDAVARGRVLDLWIRLAESTWSLSEFRKSGNAFREAAALTKSPSKRAMLLARAGWSYLWNHDFAKALEAQGEAEALATKRGIDPARVFAFIVRNEYELVHGRTMDNDSDSEAALLRARKSGDPFVIVSMLAHIGHRAEWRGDFRTAIAYTEECIVVANDNGMPSAGLFGQWFLGISYGAIGEYGKSVDMLGAGLDLCERIGDRALKARLLNTMGWLHAEFGCHARASEFNRMGTDIAREMVDLGLVAGAPELYANAAINLAGNLIALGEPNAAQEQLDAVQQQVDADDDPWMNWRYSLHLLRAQARLDLAQGDPQSAIGKLDQVLAGARGHSAKKLEALALELRGRAYSWMDQRGAARTALEEALTLAQSIEHPPVVWRAHSLLGELDRRDENAAGAAGRFADARALIEEKSRTLRDDSLRGEFRAVADLLKSDPIGSYR